MQSGITREDAWSLLREYNKDRFHLQHALTVEAVMRWFAADLNYNEEEDFWGLVGLLHDLDFEQYPQQHCIQAAKLLRENGAGEELIHAVCSHGYKITVDICPEHPMEKVLYACDELTGLIGAAALMRPSKSVADMELKDKRFAAGCSREVIVDGAGMLGWELDTLLDKTLAAMKASEEEVNEKLQEL